MEQGEGGFFHPFVLRYAVIFVTEKQLAFVDQSSYQCSFRVFSISVSSFWSRWRTVQLFHAFDFVAESGHGFAALLRPDPLPQEDLRACYFWKWAKKP
ncbi:hypothetical protein [Parapedobacter soli]|uniref:hypothetical protein n=1 Tax=Parapedobacter soli TaxID=416955 RepID=UPI0021C964A6|nr:hypothetical protein [Parapedobacter soli]